MAAFSGAILYRHHRDRFKSVAADLGRCQGQFIEVFMGTATPGHCQIKSIPTPVELFLPWTVGKASVGETAPWETPTRRRLSTPHTMDK